MNLVEVLHCVTLQESQSLHTVVKLHLPVEMFILHLNMFCQTKQGYMLNNINVVVLLLLLLLFIIVIIYYYLN